MPKKLIGTEPYQVPRNADLGTNAFQDAESVNITGGVISLSNTSTTGYFQDTAISDVKPSLMLDFANTKTLDPRITFTRASTATYYDGKTTAVAEQNLLTYSQDFDNAAWTKTRASITANAITAPDGTATADMIVEDATVTSSHYVGRANVGLNASPFVWSVYAKAGTRNWLIINSYDTANKRTWFDLSNGTVGTVVSGATASITSVGNGWYRCTVSYTPSATTTGGAYFELATSDNSTSYTGDGTSGLYIWCAQLEQRSAVSSYTPTTSSPVTNYIPALQTAAAGVPRFDHDPVTGESKGFLIEEQRTNLLTYSEQFDNAAWVLLDATISPNLSVAPDGSVTVDKLIEGTGSSTHAVYEQTTKAASQITYTFSVYLKAAERSFAKIYLSSGSTSNSVNVTVNLTDGTLGTTSSLGTFTGGVSSVSSCGNGWYRLAISGLSDTLTTLRSMVYVGTSLTTISYTGDGYSGIYIWGAQLEAGAFPTSYIPTTSAQVTRAADVATITGTNFSSFYNQSEGTLFVEHSVPAVTSNYPNAVNVNDGTQSNYFSLGFGPAANTVRFERTASGVAALSMNPSVTSSAGTFVRHAAALKLNDFATSVNGGTPLKSASGNVPTANQMKIGGYVSTTAQINGHIKRLAYYPKRLSDAELQEMTL